MAGRDVPRPEYVCYECRQPFVLVGEDPHHVTIMAADPAIPDRKPLQVPVCPECWVEIWRDMQPIEPPTA